MKVNQVIDVYPDTVSTVDLNNINQALLPMTAQQRMQWAFDNLPGEFALTSSFGIQSAVMLHMATKIKSDLPVVLTDTGYLFPETYRFIDHLTERLHLNLKVFRAELSPAWQRARYGEQWNQDQQALARYNSENKVKPLEAGLDQLTVTTWFSGIRHSQSEHRQRLSPLQVLRGRFKLHPILEWTNRDVHQYLQQHDLPYHPLWHKGYISVGDTHSTKPLSLTDGKEQTRFNGMQRECGLHTDGDGI